MRAGLFALTLLATGFAAVALAAPKPTPIPRPQLISCQAPMVLQNGKCVACTGDYIYSSSSKSCVLRLILVQHCPPGMAGTPPGCYPVCPPNMDGVPPKCHPHCPDGKVFNGVMCL